MSNIITTDDVIKVAKLANLTLTEEQVKLFATQFQQTIAVVDELKEIDTTGVGLTSSVSGLTNVTRPDVIDNERMFSQAEALSGSKNIHNGYFVVRQLIDKND